MNKILYNWSQDKMVEVNLETPDDFLKIKETLTRIGVESKNGKKLYQTCHILHKRGKYYIVHFKELFALDGKEYNLTVDDIERRDLIVSLLKKWKLLTSTHDLVFKDYQSVKVVPFKEKSEWELISKYTIGKTKGKPND